MNRLLWETNNKCFRVRYLVDSTLRSLVRVSSIEVAREEMEVKHAPLDGMDFDETYVIGNKRLL